MAPKLIRRGVSELLPIVRTGDPDRHVSAIIRSLCLKLGHYEDPGELDAAAAARLQTRFEFGSAFEEAVVAGLAARYAANDPNRYHRPGELELDGLTGTPDLVQFHPDGRLTLVEVKLTWMTSKQDPEGEKFWKYWTQVKAYCHMLGTPYAELHVGFVNGDYRNDRDPDYLVYGDTFTDHELQSNWRMLLTHGAELRRGRQA